MAYQALYRKYRPTTFSDVVGQEHITETLKNELSSGKIVHAYLFTGTRGTGKTTCAKILAKAVNCLNPINGDPCGECEMCKAIAEGAITDISEIDAASNSRVEDVRELRDQVNFAPASAKYRVYIIDEVHMLSNSAFNALLKTLEEPPPYVIFILATTEIHKLPETILSRCQRFDFRRIDPSVIRNRIFEIASREEFTVTDEAATLIAAAADGGMRDALSILDLCASSSNNIDEDTVASVCSMAGNEYLIKLTDYIRLKDTEGALILLDDLHNSSVDMLRLLTELTRHVRDLMIIKTVKTENPPIVCSASKMKLLREQADGFTLSEIMAILGVLQASFSNMQSANRRCEMEMIVIKLCNPEVASDINSILNRISALESGNRTAPKKATVKAQAVQEEQVSAPAPVIEEASPITDEASPAILQGTSDAIKEWDEILSVLKKTCPLIAGVLQGSSAYIEGDRLLIDTDNSQFRSLFNSPNPTFREAIRNAANDVLGVTYKLGPYRKKVENEGSDPLLSFAQKLKTLENK